MAMVGTNRARRVAGLFAASALCVAVAVGLFRWPDIQFELGYAYENGNFHGWTPGFALDHRKAAHWPGQAARANHPRAEYMLGILYAHGWGVPRDAARAAAWFTRAAGNGYAPACYHLGWMFHKGDGVWRDDGLAVRLLEQAAGQGMVAAHLALGGFQARGEGVSADPVRALKWYALAVHFARSRPGQFDNAAFAQRAQVLLDALSARMSRFDAEQGRRLARQWLSDRNGSIQDLRAR